MHTESVALRYERAFTLVEMLVSTALIAAIMILILNTVDQTQRLWQRTSTKVAQFQSARTAFESMTRRLAQATLNTYWRAHTPSGESETNVFLFRRQSELQFLSGPSNRIFTSPSLRNLNEDPDLAYPTHAVFFFAPLGHTEEPESEALQEVRRFRQMDNLLTPVGYFLEYGDDPNRPEFLDSINYPPRKRFRLIELVVPTEKVGNYRRPNDKPDSGMIDPRVYDMRGRYYKGLVDKDRQPNQSWIRPLWMEDALERVTVSASEGGGSDRHQFQYGRVMAENIVALIIVPKLPDKDRESPGDLKEAPFFEYDSWHILDGDTIRSGNVTIDNTARYNKLPPIVQVTMVAIDEASAVRAAGPGATTPNWTEGLFDNTSPVDSEDELLERLERLEEILRNDSNRLNYRVFSTDVVIRGSKWSEEPTIKSAR